jgi:uncharacterized protein YjiS (DUF1127 family)
MLVSTDYQFGQNMSIPPPQVFSQTAQHRTARSLKAEMNMYTNECATSPGTSPGWPATHRMPWRRWRAVWRWWLHTMSVLWPAATPTVAAPTTAADTSDPGTWTTQEMQTLESLSAHTLHDIGVPPWVHERREAARRMAADVLWR